MCGIVGYICKKGPADQQVLERMNELLTRRGPNSGGSFRRGHYGIAMRRLAIIDLSSGDQPMSNRDGSVHVVFNGEIYNFRDIRAELEAEGHHFETNSDTETILVGYQVWGEEFVHKLNGMFAIAIVDERSSKLHLFRDRLGIKPLYYYDGAEAFVFASEIKSILANRHTNAALSEEAMLSYFSYRYVPSPKTVYEGIVQLAPGCILTVDLDKNSIERIFRYWRLSFDNPLSSEEEVRHQLREVMEQSVRRRLISDVPLGAFLSGGIDSSLIVAYMAKHSEKQVRTCTIGFAEDSFDETPFARIVAEKWQTDHAERRVAPGDILEVIKDILIAHDQPMGNSGAIPYYFVCRETAKDLKVSLSGLGADELFIGYDRYLIHYYNKLLRFVPREVLIKALDCIPVSQSKRGFIRRLKIFLSSAGTDDDTHFSRLLGVIPPEAFIRKPERRAPLHLEYLREHSEQDFYQRSFYCDLNTTLLDDYLTIADRVSMFHSLEVRVPFLDHELVELSARIPSRFKSSGAQTKVLLRREFKDLLPQQILQRKKQGFELPISTWIRGELKGTFEHYLFEAGSEFLGLVQRDYVKTLFEDHIKLRQDRSRQLYTLFAAAFWEKEVLGR